MSVQEAQSKIDSAEFSEWIAYYHIDPFGNERHDLHAGIISSTIANANRAKGTRSFAPKDFMPDYTKEPGEPKQSLKQMAAIMNAFAASHNAREAAKKDG